MLRRAAAVHFLAEEDPAASIEISDESQCAELIQRLDLRHGDVISFTLYRAVECLIAIRGDDDNNNDSYGRSDSSDSSDECQIATRLFWNPNWTRNGYLTIPLAVTTCFTDVVQQYSRVIDAFSYIEFRVSPSDPSVRRRVGGISMPDDWHFILAPLDSGQVEPMAVAIGHLAIEESLPPELSPHELGAGLLRRYNMNSPLVELDLECPPFPRTSPYLEQYNFRIRPSSWRVTERSEQPDRFHFSMNGPEIDVPEFIRWLDDVWFSHQNIYFFRQASGTAFDYLMKFRSHRNKVNALLIRTRRPDSIFSLLEFDVFRRACAFM